MNNLININPTTQMKRGQFQESHNYQNLTPQNIITFNRPNQNDFHTVKNIPNMKTPSPDTFIRECCHLKNNSTKSLSENRIERNTSQLIL